MLVDIITLIVGIVLMLLAITLSFAIWGKVVEKAYDHLERLLGENITGWIFTILLFLFIITVVIDIVRP